MILEKGNMWDIYDQTDLFLITTNSSLNNLGDLIMGAGIAKEAKKRWPDIYPKYFGNEIRRSCGSYGFYGLIVAPSQHIGIFQTKTYWYHSSNLELILRSTAKLLEHIKDRPLNHLGRVDLNFPGIGKGQLNREEVLPIISVLPDIVHIWELDIFIGNLKTY